MSSERFVYKYFYVPFIILGLSNIVFNGLLCHVLRKLKKLQTISYKFILIQSIADVLAGAALVLSELVLLLINSDALYGKILVFARITCDAVCQFSGTMILIVAIDRYIHMKYLTKYNTIMTSRKAAIMVLNNLASCISMAVINVCGVYFKYYSKSHLFMNGFAVFVYTTTFLVYYKAYRSVTRRVQEMNIQEGHAATTKRPSRNKEFARAVAIILIVLALCYTPFLIVSTVKIAFECDACKASATILIAFYCTRILVCSTSSINAILFILFNKELKNYILGRSPANTNSQISRTT